jgi:hypothetical protein
LNDINNDDATTADNIVSEAENTQLIGSTVNLTPGTIYAEVGADAVNWSLSQPSTDGGYIIQQVTVTNPGQDPSSYWEAWYVPAGSESPIACTPMPWSDIVGGIPGTTPLGTVITTSASYYPDLALPADFIQNNPATGGGVLPSTTTDPSIGGAQGTAPVTRTNTYNGLNP